MSLSYHPHSPQNPGASTFLPWPHRMLWAAGTKTGFPGMASSSRAAELLGTCLAEQSLSSVLTIPEFTSQAAFILQIHGLKK